MVGWNANTVATSVPLYISWNGGATFTATSINTDISSSGTGGRIYDVSLDFARGTAAVLIRDGNAADRILILDLANTANKTLGYSSSGSASLLNAGSKGSSPRMKAFPGGELLLWGDSLAYSPDGGNNVLALTLTSRNSLLPAPGLATLEYILDVVNAYDGHFAVLTSTKRFDNLMDKY